MLFKGTAFFERTIDAYGWSESYLVSGTDRQGAMTNLVAIITARLLLASPATTATYLRISVPGEPRDGTVLANFNGSGTYVLGTNEVEAQVWDCLLYRMEDSVGHWAMKDIHAIPTAQVSNNNTPEFTVGFNTSWGIFVTALKSNTQMIVVNPTPPPAKTPVPILNVQPIRRHTRKAGRPFGLERGRRSIL